MFRIEECTKDIKNPIVILAMLIVFGEIVFFQLGLSLKVDNLKPYFDKQLLFIGKVSSRPKINRYNRTYFFDVQRIISDEGSQNTKAKLFVKGSKYVIFKRGDIVQVRGKLVSPKGPVFPGLFSEKKYLSTKGIKYALQESPGSSYLSHGRFAKLYLTIDRFREKLIMKQDGNSIALANAIVFGNRASPLNKELKTKIRELGLSHIVSASGFNVGILAAVIFFLFRLWSQNKLFPSIISFSFIWLYAGLADFSPSIIRAAIFASLVLFSNVIRKKIRVLPAISLLVILFFLNNPYNLLDLGFQLSLFAFSGLLIFYKDTYKCLMEFTSSYLKPVFTLVISSLIAQTFVFPLICYYFHNIQILGIISNLLAAPLAAAILILGILTSLFSLINLGFFFKPILLLFSEAFLLWIDLLDKIPTKEIYFPHLNIFWLILFYIFIINFFYFLIRKEIKPIMLICCAFLLAIYSLNTFNSTNSFKIYFLKRYNKDHVLVQTKNENILFFTRSFDDKDLRLVKGYLKLSHNNNSLKIKKLVKNTLIELGDLSVELIASYSQKVDSNADYVKLPILMKTDPSLETVLKNVKGKIIVNDYKRLSSSSKESIGWLQENKNSLFISESGTIEVDLRLCQVMSFLCPKG